MRWMAVGLILALQAAACGAAAACEAQAGSVVFEDTFADDSGGWDTTANVAVIKPPDFVIPLTKQYAVLQVENLTFESTFGDYCVDFVLPKTPLPDTTTSLGIIFWAKDYDNYYLIHANNNGTVNLYKKAAGVFAAIFSAAADNSPFKAEPDAVNSLRVIASKDGKLTISLNGKLVKTIRAQAPQGSLRFGFLAETDGKLLDTPVEVRLKAYKVTAGN